MEVSQTEAQLLITGAGGDQPLIMSAEDAAQLLAQAGLQLTDIGDSERIIIGESHQHQQEVWQFVFCELRNVACKCFCPNCWSP